MCCRMISSSIDKLLTGSAGGASDVVSSIVFQAVVNDDATESVVVSEPVDEQLSDEL